MDLDLTAVPAPSGWEANWPLILIAIGLILPSIRAGFELWSDMMKRNHEAKVEADRDRTIAAVDKQRDFIDAIIRTNENQTAQINDLMAKFSDMASQVQERDRIIREQTVTIDRMQKQINDMQAEIDRLTRIVERVQHADN